MGEGMDLHSQVALW